MRQVVLDTETTGLRPEDGHRIVEIGCVEIIDRRITGHKFQTYLNPGRDCDEGAFKVHGLSDDFLSIKPKFADVLYDLDRFIGQSSLIIHNAQFDAGFLKNEVRLLELPDFWDDTVYEGIICTLELAKKKFQYQKNSLNALIERYNITGFDRTKHGALLDAEILAHVYLAMTKEG
jgi:DNA polymerase-3 subunit epsilon